jgi:hypothetical protein
VSNGPGNLTHVAEVGRDGESVTTESSDLSGRLIEVVN